MIRECEYEYHLTYDTGKPFPPFQCGDEAYEKWAGRWYCPTHTDKLREGAQNQQAGREAI
jgi:hypothetical protein